MDIEKRKASKRAYWHRHKKRLTEEAKIWRAKNRKKVNETKIKWYYAHKEKILSYQKQYKNNNKEKVKKLRKAEYLRNKLRYIETAKIYYTKNKDIIKKREKQRRENLKKDSNYLLKERLRSRLKIERLCAHYVRFLIRKNSELKSQDIPECMVDAYRDFIKFKRYIKQLKRGNNDDKK